MDKKTLVECLQEIICEHAKDNLIFSLVMLIPTEPTDIDSDYSVIISAPWLDSYEPADAISMIIEAVIRLCGGTTDSLAYRKINRITPIRSNDKFVNKITSAFPVSNDVVAISNYNISGVLIERAFLLESHLPG